MLTGIRVIDFTNYLPGPFATMRLAELGAEIIKIESLEGDPARYTVSTKQGKGFVFLANNRSKKSVSLDLKNTEDRKSALNLISNADVVMESFRPGVMEKLELHFEAVTKVKPDIVYCSISGYGQLGTFSKLGSHDINYLALSGVLSQIKDRNGMPILPTITLADYIGGLAANERILAGLVNKLTTGKGGYHSISITDQMVSLLGNHIMIEKESGDGDGISLLNGSIVCYGIYETKDGRYMSLGALEPKFWHNFCLANNRQDWIQAHFTKAISTNQVFDEMTSLFRSKTFNEWIEFAQHADCCMAPVLEIGELLENPYFKEKELIFSSSWGDYQVKMHSDLPYNPQSAPPNIGEHNEQLINKL